MSNSCNSKDDSCESSGQNWLAVAGDPLSAESRDLLARLNSAVESQIAQGKFSRDNIAYIEKMHLKAATSGNFKVGVEQLEKLRRACQVWDVDLHLREITSHRPVVGKVIVAFKKALYPVLKLFLKDFIRQQRQFNAAVLALIVDLYTQQDEQSSSKAKPVDQKLN